MKTIFFLPEDLIESTVECISEAYNIDNPLT